MTPLTYNPDIFSVPDADAARRIILTEEGGLTTDSRWEIETPYLVELIRHQLAPYAGGLLIDYGCGIGRLAKALIEQIGCAVLGVDLSPDMRSLAHGYVQSDAFSVVSPLVFRRLVNSGLRADGAFSVWVIQHCLQPGRDLDLIREGLHNQARLVIVNNRLRVVPTIEIGWADDGKDVRGLVAERFQPIAEGNLDPAYVGNVLANCAYWGSYQKQN